VYMISVKVPSEVVSAGSQAIHVTASYSSVSGRRMSQVLPVNAPSSGTSIVIVYSMVSPIVADHHVVSALVDPVTLIATSVSVVYVTVAVS
jgi:hypothetical protein